jgi:hypothetical protein
LWEIVSDGEIAPLGLGQLLQRVEMRAHLLRGVLVEGCGVYCLNRAGQREFKAVSASYGDTVLNLVVAAGYLSSLIGNPRVSGYLERRHPEILSEFKAIVAATSLEESASGGSEEPALLD